MLSFLTDLQIDLAIGAVAYIAGVLTSTKVIDFFQGVPTELRSALTSAKTNALSALKTARADVVAKVIGTTATKTAAPTPVAPVAAAPAAAAPAAPAAAPAASTAPAA